MTKQMSTHEDLYGIGLHMIDNGLYRSRAICRSSDLDMADSKQLINEGEE